MTLGQIIKAQFENLPIVPQDCGGQTYIVTGANTGLGLECARHFVRLGASHVILASRSLSKGEAAVKSIEASTGRKGVAEVWQLDLTSYDSVRAFAKRVEELERVDAVVQNAGVAMGVWTEAEGNETTITVNVISTFLLAMLLLPKLRAQKAKWGIVPRMTIVSSGRGVVAQFAEGKEEDVFEALNTKNEMTMRDRYPVSKLIELLGVRAMAADLPLPQSGVIINSLSPGICKTQLNRNSPFWVWLQIEIMRLLVARTAEQGSRTLLHAAVVGEEGHGKFLTDCEIKEDWLAGSENLRSKELQDKVWKQLCEKLEKIEPGCVTRAMDIK
ncbi:NAD(P)-binding protein [Viridothelium virens]|uniref:NAD(P)-binding protein n=1 Tax=Viridothelium virens TaxID=1048519 RepID=A0A6A6H6B5_VIRVR|nr:NAD(P)-binding protein [Viridothelium virens]